MTAVFDKLKTSLTEKGTLSEEEITQAGSELTPEETAWLMAELHEKQRSAQVSVTMEQFLEANKILDTADENSDEYKAAQKIADAFLAGN